MESDTEDEEVPEATEEQLFQQRKERLPEEEEHPAALTPQESSDERHKIQNQVGFGHPGWCKTGTNSQKWLRFQE